MAGSNDKHDKFNEVPLLDSVEFDSRNSQYGSFAQPDANGALSLPEEFVPKGIFHDIYGIYKKVTHSPFGQAVMKLPSIGFTFVHHLLGIIHLARLLSAHENQEEVQFMIFDLAIPGSVLFYILRNNSRRHSEYVDTVQLARFLTHYSPQCEITAEDVVFLQGDQPFAFTLRTNHHYSNRKIGLLATLFSNLQVVVESIVFGSFVSTTLRELTALVGAVFDPEVKHVDTSDVLDSTLILTTAYLGGKWIELIFKHMIVQKRYDPVFCRLLQLESPEPRLLHDLTSKLSQVRQLHEQYTSLFEEIKIAQHMDDTLHLALQSLRRKNQIHEDKLDTLSKEKDALKEEAFENGKQEQALNNGAQSDFMQKIEALDNDAHLAMVKLVEIEFEIATQNQQRALLAEDIRELVIEYQIARSTFKKLMREANASWQRLWQMQQTGQPVLRLLSEHSFPRQGYVSDDSDDFDSYSQSGNDSGFESVPSTSEDEDEEKRQSSEERSTRQRRRRFSH